MPEEITGKGLALNDLRRLLSGKWRGNCHPGELGAALRKLGNIEREIGRRQMARLKLIG